MPELPEPGSEFPCPHMNLPAMVDEAGARYERKAADLERWAERLSREMAEDVAVNHLPLETPATAKARHVGTWPNGEPMVIVTYWVPPSDQG